MAARNLAPVRALIRELIPVTGSFAPNNTGTVAATSRTGLGWSVARTSAGLFSVTFTDKYSGGLVAAVAQLQLATADDKFVQIGTWTASTRVLQIRVWDVSGAAVADVAANANNRINFTAWFRNIAGAPVQGN